MNTASLIRDEVFNWPESIKYVTNGTMNLRMRLQAYMFKVKLIQ